MPFHSWTSSGTGDSSEPWSSAGVCSVALTSPSAFLKPSSELYLFRRVMGLKARFRAVQLSSVPSICQGNGFPVLYSNRKCRA